MLRLKYIFVRYLLVWKKTGSEIFAFVQLKTFNRFFDTTKLQRKMLNERFRIWEVFFGILFTEVIYLKSAIVQLIHTLFSLFSLCIQIYKATMVHVGNNDVKNLHGAIIEWKVQNIR